jgi:light-harvesting complex I chlorophyll a/b binding protein 5
VQAELVHGRWAMLGVAGILFTSIGAAAGLGFPQWYEAGKVAAASSYASFPNLLITTFLLMGWAEGKRWADIKNPGSQGDGSFFGITDDFKGKENGYPGGRFFDPMGLSRGSEAQYKKYKENEIKNGRLAMVAMLGFFAQYSATGKGPIENLAQHLSAPAQNTFATNGVSLPWLQ